VQTQGPVDVALHRVGERRRGRSLKARVREETIASAVRSAALRKKGTSPTANAGHEHRSRDAQCGCARYTPVPVVCGIVFGLALAGALRASVCSRRRRRGFTVPSSIAHRHNRSRCRAELVCAPRARAPKSRPGDESIPPNQPRFRRGNACEPGTWNVLRRPTDRSTGSCRARSDVRQIRKREHGHWRVVRLETTAERSRTPAWRARQTTGVVFEGQIGRRLTRPRLWARATNAGLGETRASEDSGGGGNRAGGMSGADPGAGGVAHPARFSALGRGRNSWNFPRARWWPGCVLDGTRAMAKAAQGSTSGGRRGDACSRARGPWPRGAAWNPAVARPRS